MAWSLRISILLLALFLLVGVIVLVKKGRIPVKYSLIWIFCILILCAVALIPGILMLVSSMLGFLTMSNMVIGIFLVILLIITLSLTVIVSGQKKKINLLIQEISLLKAKREQK